MEMNILVVLFFSGHMKTLFAVTFALFLASVMLGGHFAYLQLLRCGGCAAVRPVLDHFCVIWGFLPITQVELLCLADVDVGVKQKRYLRHQLTAFVCLYSMISSPVELREVT